MRCHSMLHLIFLLPLSVYGATPSHVEEILFTKTTSTGTASCLPLDGAEMSREVTSRTAVQCCVRCGETQGCRVASFSPGDATCLLYAQPWDPAQCSELGDWRTFVERGLKNTVTTTEKMTTTQAVACENGGSLKTDNSSCQCFNGFVGDRCERYMEDCGEGVDSGHVMHKQDNGTSTKKQRWYWAKPRLARQPVLVYCRFDGATLFQRHKSSDDDFNATWQEYVDGFGDQGLNFWMGLRDLYTFTRSKRYHLELYFKLQNETTYYVTNGNFSLADNVTYTAQLGAVIPGGDLPGHLGDMNGQAFSTYDNDKDNNASVSCAQVYGGGWWFSQSCADVNFHGHLVTDAEVWSGNLADVHYKGLGDIAFVSMSLRLVPPT